MSALHLIILSISKIFCDWSLCQFDVQFCNNATPSGSPMQLMKSCSFEGLFNFFCHFPRDADDNDVDYDYDGGDWRNE